MSLGEHLRELRYRIIVSALSVTVGAIVAFIFRGPVLDFVTRPYCDLPEAATKSIEGKCTLSVFGVLDAFNLSIKISINVGIIATAPIWLWQLWRFLAPGLKAKERRYVLTFVVLSSILFFAGAAVAYYTLPNGLEFLVGFGGDTFQPLIEAKNYISFLLAMVLVFGIAFEFPLLIVMLNLVGIVSAKKLSAIRRPMIFVIAVFAGVATPSQDPYTMLALAFPMWALYEVATLIARLHDRRSGTTIDGVDYDKLDDEESSSIAAPSSI